MLIWFLWFKHRWQAISAFGIALLALLLVVLMMVVPTLAITFLAVLGGIWIAKSF